MRRRICRKCGRCCRAKIILNDEVVYTPFSCPHLDATTKLCTVYHRRFEVNPDCLTVEEGIAMGVFPADCPFVRDLPSYRPPRQRLTRKELAAIYPDVDALVAEKKRKLLSK